MCESCSKPADHAEYWSRSTYQPTAVRVWCEQHTPWSGHYEWHEPDCARLVAEARGDQQPPDLIERTGLFDGDWSDQVVHAERVYGPATTVDVERAAFNRDPSRYMQLASPSTVVRVQHEGRVSAAFGGRFNAGPEDFGGSDFETGFESGWERQMREMAEQKQTEGIKTKRTYEAKLAKVKSASMHIEDHGVLTCVVDLDGGGWGQGFGCLCLSRSDPDPNDKSYRQRGTAQGLDFILRVLELFGVDKLSQCEGRTVYALYAEPYALNDSIVGLRLPDFDGGREFLLDAWRQEWETRAKELVR